MSFHKQVANMLRDKYPKTIARSPEEFARHCEGGGEYEAAAIYYLKAGEQAILKSASIEAVDLISKTLSLCESIDDPIKQDALELQAHITIGAPLQAAKGFADPNVLETYERALQLSKNIGDLSTDLHTSVLWGIFSFNLVRGNLIEANNVSLQLERLAESAGSKNTSLVALNARGAALYYNGYFRQAAKIYETALTNDSLERSHSLRFSHAQDHGVTIKISSAITSWILGDSEKSKLNVTQAISLAKELQRPLSIAFSLGFGGAESALRGDIEGAELLSREVIELATDQCFPLWAAFGRIVLGWSLGASLNDDQGVKMLRQGMKESARTGAAFEAPFCFGLIADAYLRVGRHEDAMGAVSMGQSIAQRNSASYWDAELLRLKGECIASRDNEISKIEAESCLQSALAIANLQAAENIIKLTNKSLRRLKDNDNQRAG